jgi:hypothetical protein
VLARKRQFTIGHQLPKEAQTHSIKTCSGGLSGITYLEFIAHLGPIALAGLF